MAKQKLKPKKTCDLKTPAHLYPDSQPCARKTFSTSFDSSARGKPRLEYLTYLLNQNKNQQVNREVKSPKSILIKTEYPNLLQSCTFLCFNLINYYTSLRRKKGSELTTDTHPRAGMASLTAERLLNNLLARFFSRKLCNKQK